MNRSVSFDKLGGLYVYQDTLDFLQKAYGETFEGLAKGLGDKFVLSGCAEDGAGNVADGMIVINGELLSFIGGAIQANVFIEEIVTPEQFDDGTLKDTYIIRRARMSALSPAGSFPYTDLKRNKSSILDSIDSFQKILNGLIHFEPEVIISGLTVSGVTVGPNNCNISAGLVSFNGALKTVQAYTGSYPVYLTQDATWTNAMPGAGLYITFDPHTSQRYIDVVTRAQTKPGKIEMYETLSDRFVGGIGRWEMKGFVLASAMQNRVPVGLWFDGVAEANVSDPYNATAGPTRKAGERNHKLSPTEQGELKWRVRTDDGDDREGAYKSITQIEIGGQLVDGVTIGDQAYSAYKFSKLENNAADHNNMQPHVVVVYVKRS